MTEEKKDIFDKIMDARIFGFFRPFYIKHKEVLLYLFFGGLTFIVSIASYAIFNVGLGIQPLIANLFSWVLAVLFAYATNRKWVFSDVEHTGKGVLREITTFFGGRVFTLILEEGILYVGITLMGIGSIPVKVVGQVVVIVTNYFISKVLVFRAKK